MFELRQWNSKGEKDDVIYQIMETAAFSFGGSRSIEEFVKTESMISINSSKPRQFLYLMDGDMVVASLGVIIRDGLAPSSLNLLVILVNTHPLYRKQGIMNELINQLMKYYENGNLTHDEWEVDDQTLEDASIFKHKYLNSFPKENIFWTLYSAIGDYYERFGFVPNKEFIQLIKKIDISIINNEKFTILPNERILFQEKDSHFLTHTEYLPNKTFTNMDRNVSFRDLPFFDFVSRSKIYCEMNHIPFQEEIGFEIQHHNEFTRVFVTPDIKFNGLCIHRIYSNVNSKDVLILHLERAFEYVHSHYAKWYLNLPAVKKNQVIMRIKVSPADFMLLGNCKIDDISDQLLNFGYNEVTEGVLIPMSKDFGARGINEYSTWPYNGFWAFN